MRDLDRIENFQKIQFVYHPAPGILFLVPMTVHAMKIVLKDVLVHFKMSIVLQTKFIFLFSIQIEENKLSFHGTLMA